MKGLRFINRLVYLSFSIFGLLYGCDETASSEKVDEESGVSAPLGATIPMAGMLATGGGMMTAGQGGQGGSVAGETTYAGIEAGRIQGGESAGVQGGEAGTLNGGASLLGGSLGGSVQGGMVLGGLPNSGGMMAPSTVCTSDHELGEEPALEGRLSDPRGAFQVRVEGEGCQRRFTLQSTAPQRDPGFPRERLILEENLGLSLHTHNPITDALYALTISEVKACSVASISDGSFLQGNPLPCEEGGCFETGALWTYVWTRDTAYSVDLGLALIDPRRATNSLRFKLSPKRDGEGLQIVQDTGSGGSYPISTDRSVWALGAYAALANLSGSERDRFELEAYEAMRTTIAHDRVVIYDEQDGLYRGEQSFLDWREQSYPEWVADDVVHLGMSKSLSTNVAHYALLSFTAELARRVGDTQDQARYADWANSLKNAINEHLWLEDEGQYSAFIVTSLDQAPSYRFDLLGSALAIITGVASQNQAERIISTYPLLPYGPSVQWPQLRDVPIYHNRGIWPFVTAYALRAARRIEHPTMVNHLMESLLKGVALNLSNMENLDAGTGLAFAEDGTLSGPVVNSQRQLWSVAGTLSLFHELLFGLKTELDGLRVVPWITEYARQTVLGGASQISLNGLYWQERSLNVTIRFAVEDLQNMPNNIEIDSPLVWTASEVLLNGNSLASNNLIEALPLETSNLLEITVQSSNARGASLSVRSVDPSDDEQYFAPRTPVISSASRTATGVSLSLHLNGEGEGRTLNIYRDGTLIASGLNPLNTWIDQQAPLQQSLCYTAELVSIRSGTRSQRAQPWCVWTQIDTLYAGDFTAQGGSRVDEYGRIHYQAWGNPEDLLSIEWTATRSGPAFLQAEYGNGAGAINTGITCAVKRLDLVSLPDGQVLDGGYLMMPHLGRWDRWSGSNFIEVNLTEGHQYRLIIREDDFAFNMSYLEHFASYSGGSGGVSGSFNRVNISALKVLYLE